MLNPENIQIYDKQSVSNIITFNSLPEYDREEYNLFDENQFKKYMTDVENNVRNSYEYRYKLLPFLREYMNMRECSFYKNVNNLDTFKIKIEIHHTPFSLYDICKIVLDKRTFYNQAIDVQSVAEEVTLLHYCGLVGLIPLSETVHKLAHNNYLFIPTNIVMGRYKDFVEIYRPWIDEELLNTLDLIEKYSSIYSQEQTEQLLSRKYTYIDFSGEYYIPKTEDIYQLVSDKVQSLKYGIEQKMESINLKIQ